MPETILQNVTDQIYPQMPVPKRLEDYSEEEIKNFPGLFEWLFYLFFRFFYQ